MLDATAHEGVLVRVECRLRGGGDVPLARGTGVLHVEDSLVKGKASIGEKGDWDIRPWDH